MKYETISVTTDVKNLLKWIKAFEHIDTYDDLMKELINLYMNTGV